MTAAPRAVQSARVEARRHLIGRHVVGARGWLPFYHVLAAIAANFSCEICRRVWIYLGLPPGRVAARIPRGVAGAGSDLTGRRNMFVLLLSGIRAAHTNRPQPSISYSSDSLPHP
jgi:hypothetical protein